MTDDYRLGAVECYDPRQKKTWSFKKACDIVHGIPMRLGNMCGGFPFEFAGRTWADSERLYLCGQFSDIADSRHAEAQQALCSALSGYAAKRFYRNKYRDLIRDDFPEIRLQWMLFVVWTKCLHNADFRQLLTSIPADVTLVEDTTTDHCVTAHIWGCSNPDLLLARREQEATLLPRMAHMTRKEANRRLNIEWNRLDGVGLWRGQNNMGKILMACRDALRTSTEPAIDFALLRSHPVHLFGIPVSF